MNGQDIEPHKVTKPIQLLAAWLVGLILTNFTMLTTALRLPDESWERRFLVIAAVFNVPLFLAALFRLQTKFRAELQDDVHYSQYLSKKTSESVRVAADASLEARVNALESTFSVRSTSALVSMGNAASGEESDKVIKLDWSQWRIALNDHIPRFADIRDALRRNEVPLTEIFGDSHDPDAEGPGNLVVSINRAMPFDHKLFLIRLLAPFGLDGFQYWTPVKEADENEDVYIGSYGVTRFTPFNADLIALLSQNPEKADLDYFRRTNRIAVRMPDDQN